MGRLHPKTFLHVPLANAAASPLLPPPSHSLRTSTAAAAAAATPSPLNLATREDSTRVRLQKQRLDEQQQQQQHAIVISQRIPGFKTSAAFFASLRTNLRLNSSPPSSPFGTPQSMRGSTGSLPPPSPLAIHMESTSDYGEATPAEDPLADVPELKTYIAQNEAEKVAALRLVADSVAQQRQIANSALIFHPLNMALVVAVLALVARNVYDWKRDPVVTGSTCSGIIMLFLAGCRYATQNYLLAAEDINWQWLGESADVFVTKFGDEIIGTAVVEWVSEDSRQRRKKAWRGEIKGWAVRLRYRGKGVGSALLEEVVREFRNRGAETIEFAEEHANALRVLPRFYNGQMDQREQKARDLLQDLREQSPTKWRRKRGGSRDL